MMDSATVAQQATALIVEDNADLASVFGFALKEAGFEIEVVHDGQAALEQLATWVPRVIVLDLHLPNVPGSDVLDFVLADDRFAATRIIIASADYRLAEALSRSKIIILTKPISFKQLRDLSARLKMQPSPS